MFLVEHRWAGGTNWVFTEIDPREDGFEGTPVEGVTLEQDLLENQNWPDGAEAPTPSLGRDPKNPKHYKEFKYPRELQAAGFTPLSGRAMLFRRWSDYPQRDLK